MRRWQNNQHVAPATLTYQLPTTCGASTTPTNNQHAPLATLTYQQHVLPVKQPLKST